MFKTQLRGGHAILAPLDRFGCRKRCGWADHSPGERERGGQHRCVLRGCRPRPAYHASPTAPAEEENAPLGLKPRLIVFSCAFGRMLPSRRASRFYHVRGSAGDSDNRHSSSYTPMPLSHSSTSVRCLRNGSNNGLEVRPRPDGGDLIAPPPDLMQPLGTTRKSEQGNDPTPSALAGLPVVADARPRTGRRMHPLVAWREAPHNQRIKPTPGGKARGFPALRGLSAAPLGSKK